jgi:hypothetical protein
VVAASGSAAGVATAAAVGDGLAAGSATGSSAGTSTAVGVGASIAAATGAAAGGSTAAGVSNAPAPEPAASTMFSGGYDDTRRHTYKVRIGKRVVIVDPLDPMSVRAAMDLARDEAEEAAERLPAAPQRAAARSVQVKPEAALGVDYEALRANAQRISDQVRAVYAQALQREMTAHLLRSRMDAQDEDDAEALLMIF